MAVFPSGLFCGREQLRAEEENFSLYILERKAIEKPSHKRHKPEGSQLSYFLHNIQALYSRQGMPRKRDCLASVSPNSVLAILGAADVGQAP